MALNISERHKLTPFMLFFILYNVQVGVGILGYQRSVSDYVGSDGWITIFIASFAILFVLWMALKILKDHDGDLITIHKALFGKWIGGALTLFILCYYLSMGVAVLNSYVSLVQVWMFPNVSYWVLAILVSAVAYSYISGGIRSIAGISFLSIIYALPLILVLFYPLKFIHYSNLLPIMAHKPMSMALSVKAMVLNFEGLSIIFMVYPFIKQAQKAHRWALYTVFITTFIYVCLFIISVCYFDKNELDHIYWPTLSLWKIVNLPFLERFEYIGITIWFFVILPNFCLVMWGASRGVKRLFSVNQRISVIIFLAFVIIVGWFFHKQVLLEKWNEWQSLAGIGILFIYIPLLFIYNFIHKKMKKVRKQHGKA